MRRKQILQAMALAAVAAALPAASSAQSYGPWMPAVNVETLEGTHPALNTTALEGCPAVSRDDHTLYFASNRAGGHGGLDIWVARRTHVNGAWGEPVNLGPAINSAADEFCPSPTRTGRGLLFVSTRPGGCGGADIYVSYKHGRDGWTALEHFDCRINSAADEASPFIVKHDGKTELYFSSTRSGNSDIYVSTLEKPGVFGAPSPVVELNTAAGDFRPNLRRDGLEIFFDSNRTGSLGLDIWTATRESVWSPWSVPVPLGLDVNSSGNDLRAFLSWDGTALYFGSTRAGSEGSQDLYVTRRAIQP